MGQVITSLVSAFDDLLKADANVADLSSWVYQLLPKVYLVLNGKSLEQQRQLTESPQLSTQIDRFNQWLSDANLPD